MARSTQYSLSVIRGLLGLVVAIQLLLVVYLIQTGLDELIRSAAIVPTSLIPILNVLQITVILSVFAALLLMVGLYVRLVAKSDLEKAILTKSLMANQTAIPSQTQGRRYCLECGTMNPSGASYCVSCGVQFPAE